MKKLVYGASIKGNGHYISGTVCQDSNSFEETDFSDDEIKVISLSDGHGGAAYFRSDIGSKYAAMIAKKVMYKFIKENKKLLDIIDTKKTNFIEEPRYYKNNLSRNEKKERDKITNELCEIEEKRKSYDLVKKCISFKEEGGDINSYELFIDLNPEQKKLVQKYSLKKFNNKIYDPLVNRNIELNKKRGKIIENSKGEEITKTENVIDNSSNKSDKIKTLRENFTNVKKDILDERNKKVDEHLSQHPVDIATVKMFNFDSYSEPPHVREFIGYVNNETDGISMINNQLNQKMVSNILKNPRQIYGATLLCIGSYKNHNFIVQIGDGDVAVVDEKDRVSFPVIKPDNQIANETNSICQIDALNRFSDIYFEKPIKMMMISSDGISNAIDFSQFKDLALGIYEEISKEPKSFREEFKPLLRNFSNGSSDDCTICFIANNISDNDYELIKNAKEIDDINDLEKTYIPMFDKFELNNKFYPHEKIDEGKSIVSINIYNPDISTEAITNAFIPLKNEFVNKLNDIATYSNIHLDNNARSILIIKKLNNIRSDLNELLTKFRKSYFINLDNYLSDNPVIIIKTDILHISVNSKSAIESDYKQTKYGIVTSINDRKISFVDITKDDYDKITNNFSLLFNFNGTIRLNTQHYIEIKNNNFQIIRRDR